MHEIKDAGLYESGIRKIEWVRRFMPALSEIETEFKRTQPFKGKKITVSVHLEAKTANLGLVLRAGGAEVFVTGCNPLSTQDDVAAGLHRLGVPVFGFRGATAEEYERHLEMALSCHPDLIVDDGGDLVNLLTSKCPEYADRLIGGCEETTTGIARLYSRQKAGILSFPMMAVNDAKCKRSYDNRYGTGQSTWDSIMHNTNLIVAGKTVVIAGYGYCGRGIAARASGMGANVIVTEIDPFKALEANMDGYRIMTMDEAAAAGDIFITATGCRDVITGRHFDIMKDDAVLSNAGHFDVEVNVNELTGRAVEIIEQRDNIRGYRMADGRTLNLLAEGRLVNLAGGNGHPAEIMDMSFSVQALALEYLVKNGASMENKVYNIPSDIDDRIACYKLKALGIKIDELTPEQDAYLNAWEH